jgi:long-chain acyl-CoA synthetase
MENNIVSMIETRARRFGDREVLKYKDSNTMKYNGISWEEFWSNSQKIARAILASGYGHGNNIGIMCDNMPEWTMIDIGILASRNIVVPFFGNAS